MSWYLIKPWPEPLPYSSCSGDICQHMQKLGAGRSGGCSHCYMQVMPRSIVEDKAIPPEVVEELRKDYGNK